MHADAGMTHEEFFKSDLKKSMTRMFTSPTLVFSRPIFREEVDAGLPLDYVGSMVDWEAPDDAPPRWPQLTVLLDGLYNLIDGIQWRGEVFREDSRTPTYMIGDYIAQHYYDCMSGGMPHAAVLACRLLVRQYNCDLGHALYPSSEDHLGSCADGKYDGWYTIGDFLESTKGSEAEMALVEPYIKGLLGTGSP